MTSRHERVTVLIPARDEQATIGSLLDSLAAQVFEPDEVLIVDAGSMDSTRDVVRRYATRGTLPIRLIEAGASFPGRARNVGVAQIDSGIVAFLDAGVRIGPDWLKRLIAPFRADELLDVVYGSYEPVLDTLFQHAAAVTWVDQRSDRRAIRAESVASLAIRRRVWTSDISFREDLRAAEDLLFKEHLRTSGLRCADAPDAIIYWELPERPADVFRKFFNYSRDTINAGLARRWHAAVAIMYVVLIIAMAVGWLLSRTILVPLAIVVLFYLSRAVVNARRKAEFVGRGMQPIAIVALTSLMVSIVDMAMFAGAASWAAGMMWPAKAPR
jgi:glycosyltransferase involved in cell wall biosynthesis